MSALVGGVCFLIVLYQAADRLARWVLRGGAS